MPSKGSSRCAIVFINFFGCLAERQKGSERGGNSRLAGRVKQVSQDAGSGLTCSKQNDAPAFEGFRRLPSTVRPMTYLALCPALQMDYGQFAAHDEEQAAPNGH